MSAAQQWKENLPFDEWDNLLSAFSGHPLQSALWGEAKKKIHGVEDLRLALCLKQEFVGLARIESKGPAFFKKIAWVPQFSVKEKESEELFKQLLLEKLKTEGYVACILSPYASQPGDADRKTVILDLSVGIDALWKNLDKQWRYGVTQARKREVSIHMTHADDDVRQFNELCQVLEKKKNFSSKDRSKSFFSSLLEIQQANLSGKLFVAKKCGEFCGGALVLCSGKRLHYMWGCVDRRYSKDRVGEFIQWSVMEWACNQGYTEYDLEGVDEINNPGVAAFKKKMGGTVVNLKPMEVYALTKIGRVLSCLIKKYYL
jgi:lipid II:glycine glycyltransferase (peptidoglycan interpeptide bridge formation enzyme)